MIKSYNIYCTYYFIMYIYIRRSVQDIFVNNELFICCCDWNQGLQHSCFSYIYHPSDLHFTFIFLWCTKNRNGTFSEKNFDLDLWSLDMVEYCHFQKKSLTELHKKGSRNIYFLFFEKVIGIF